MKIFIEVFMLFPQKIYCILVDIIKKIQILRYLLCAEIMKNFEDFELKSLEELPFYCSWVLKLRKMFFKLKIIKVNCNSKSLIKISVLEQNKKILTFDFKKRIKKFINNTTNEFHTFRQRSFELHKFYQQKTKNRIETLKKRATDRGKRGEKRLFIISIAFPVCMWIMIFNIFTKNNNEVEFWNLYFCV